MHDIVRQTPNVRAAWFQSVRFGDAYDNSPPSGLAMDCALCLWPNLEKLHASSDVHMPIWINKSSLSGQITEFDVDGDNYWRFGIKPENPEAHHLLVGRGAATFTNASSFGVLTSILARDLVSVPEAQIPLEFPELDHLCRLSLKGKYPVSHKVLGTLLSQNALFETLRILELHPFPFHAFPITACSDRRGRNTRDYSFLRSDAIEYFSVRGLRAEAGPGGLIEDADHELLAIVAQFPNLQSLDVGSEAPSPATLGRIVESGVRRIYCPGSWEMQNVVDWAMREHGASIIRGPSWIERSAPGFRDLASQDFKDNKKTQVKPVFS
jgi:hypothetical protein